MFMYISACFQCVLYVLEATLYPPRIEIRPSSASALVGATVVLRCFAYLQQDSLIHMEWSLPAQVRQPYSVRIWYIH